MTIFRFMTRKYNSFFDATGKSATITSVLQSSFLRAARVVVLFLLFVVFVPPAVVSGFDYGLILENETTGVFVDGKDADVEQQNDALAFLQQDLTEDIEANLRFRYRYTDDDPLFWELESAALEGFAPEQDGQTVVEMAIGRTTLRDFSGALLNEQADLIRWGLLRPNITVRAVGGYFGLRRNESSDIVLSTSDVADVADEAFFAPPRGVVGLEVGFPEQLGRQNLTVGGYYQHDFRHDGATRVDTAYAGAGLAGPFSRFVFYDLFGYLATGFVEAHDGGRDPLLSWYAGGGILLFAEEALFTRVQSRFVYARGDEDYESSVGPNRSGKGRGFPALTSPTLAEVVSPRVSNIAGTSLSYSLKPLATSRTVWSELQVAATGWAFFRSSPGVVAIAGTVPGGDASFLGWEADLSVRFRPVSDFAVALAGGFFRRADNDAWLEAAPEYQAAVRLFGALSL